jgi:hypothetical protein
MKQAQGPITQILKAVALGMAPASRRFGYCRSFW